MGIASLFIRVHLTISVVVKSYGESSDMMSNALIVNYVQGREGHDLLYYTILASA
jgi:hypothetical protein